MDVNSDELPDYTFQVRDPDVDVRYKISMGSYPANQLLVSLVDDIVDNGEQYAIPYKHLLSENASLTLTSAAGSRSEQIKIIDGDMQAFFMDLPSGEWTPY